METTYSTNWEIHHIYIDIYIAFFFFLLILHHNYIIIESWWKLLGRLSFRVSVLYVVKIVNVVTPQMHT